VSVSLVEPVFIYYSLPPSAVLPIRHHTSMMYRAALRRQRRLSCIAVFPKSTESYDVFRMDVRARMFLACACFARTHR